MLFPKPHLDVKRKYNAKARLVSDVRKMTSSRISAIVSLILFAQHLDEFLNFSRIFLYFSWIPANCCSFLCWGTSRVHIKRVMTDETNKIKNSQASMDSLSFYFLEPTNHRNFIVISNYVVLWLKTNNCGYCHLNKFTTR